MCGCLGNLTKLTGTDELAKAQEDVRDRLQKMKRLLNRVGSTIEEAAAPADREDKVEQANPVKPVQRRTSAPVDSIAAAIAAKKSDAVTKMGIRPSDGRDVTKLASSASPPPTSVDGVNETERIPRVVHRTRTVQSLIRRSYADAGTDPFESLMSNNKPVVIQTPTHGCEMETQTTLPPAPLLSSSKSGSLRRLESEFSSAKEKEHEQNNEESTAPEDAIKEAQNNETPRPQQDGDAIEAEMKQFLIQHVMDSSDGNQNRAEEQPEEDVDPAKFWSDSPRLDPIKTAERRKPPTSLSRTGYRSFRMPSRPSSSDSI